jgi:hypothetical protein
LFPMLYEEMKGLVPEVYFGGEEVPAYLHLECEASGSLEDLVSSIRAIGSGSTSSGYIDNEGIHFHIPDDETIYVDLSKEFVFVSQPGVTGGENPSAWQIFKFMQEPVSRALFIAFGRATLVEKTEWTLLLCKALDQLWSDEERFLETRKEMVEYEDAREKGLVCLMKAYEEGTLGSSSEMWEFWQTFAAHLMQDRLGLKVTQYGRKIDQ